MSEKKTKASGKTDAKNKKGAATGAFSVYIGPTIMGVIQSGTIYAEDKPSTLKKLTPAVEKYPLIASLVVTGEELVEARVKVKMPGNLLYVNYHKMVSGKK